MDFSLKTFREDFIMGVSPENIQATLKDLYEELSHLESSVYDRGVLIAERDPIRFTLCFLVCLEKKIPVILGNPDWSVSEWRSFDMQFAPAISYGRSHNKNCTQVKRLTVRDKGVVFIPTGGTTSAQLKFAKHRWASLKSQAEMVQCYLKHESINAVCCLPLFHVSGLMQVVRSIVSGGQIRFALLEDLLKFDSGLQFNTFCISLVPTQLQRIYDADPAFGCLKNFKRIFLGGAPANVFILKKALAEGVPIAVCYGMTETAGMVVVQEEFDRPDAGGKPFPDVIITLNQEDAIPKVNIQSPSLFEGYHGSPNSDLENGFLTNDIGSLTASGLLRVEGRADQLIVSGGEKIAPSEVETLIRRFESVSDVLVVGEFSEEWGQSVVALVVPMQSVASSFKTDSLHGFLKKHLAKYKIPKRYILVSKLPLLENGKIDKDSLALLLKD